MNKVFLGIDNGVSGSIGYYNGENIFCGLVPTPTIEQQDYTKTKKRLRRLDGNMFNKIIQAIQIAFGSFGQKPEILAIIERPMINPGRFQATMSAIRCMEATLIVLESLNIPFMFVDSKQWQKDLLPQGCEKEQLKAASHDIGIRTFPDMKEQIEKQKDADGLLIALWGYRKGL